MPFEDAGLQSLTKTCSLLDDVPLEGPESITSTSSGCSNPSSVCSNLSSGYSSGKFGVRLKESPEMGTTKYELEDYIYEMECRQAEASQRHNELDEETQDIYTRLAQKEQDLILAAELGKALLERNEVLVHQNEKLAEDYCHKLEILEQEKHSLRRKFASKEGEYDVKLQELAVDLQCAKHELEDTEELHRVMEREKTQTLEDLTEQNQRLTAQLKESAKKEEQLNQQIQHLREQFTLRRANVSEQVTAVEMLKEEIGMLVEKKYDLEKRIESLSMEREGLSVTLDESTDKILMLERQSRDKEQQIRSSHRDMEDLRHTNLSLTDRLEAISRNSSSPSGHTSLMNEMDLSDQDVSRPSLPEDLLEMDEEIECDEPILSPLSDAESLKQLRQEVVESTSQLRSLVEQMRHQRRNSLTSISTNSSDDLSVNNLKPGVLKETAKELKGLVRQLLRREAKGQCSACGRAGPEDKLQMEQEVHRAQETLDKVNIELAEKTEKLKAKTDEAEHLEQKIMLKNAQMKAVEEERDNLKHDLSNTHLAKDELIKKAWDMRDNAVARKNACEIELAKTRIDVMQVNSQLMEAIQQKVELSQQLEQWQVDMQQLLDDQMRRKLDRLENSGVFSTRAIQGSESDSSSSTKNSPKKTFKIFALLSHLRRSPASTTSNSNDTSVNKTNK